MTLSYNRGLGFPENNPSGSASRLAVCMVSAPTYTNGHSPIVEPFGGVFSSTGIEKCGHPTIPICDLQHQHPINPARGKPATAIARPGHGIDSHRRGLPATFAETRCHRLFERLNVASSALIRMIASSTRVEIRHCGDLLQVAAECLCLR